MNNYEFCAQWILDQAHGNDVRVLDYGCGAGQIVDELRKRRVNAFGCDVFYGGGDCSKSVHPKFFGSFIKRMENYIIPFDSDLFDFVINNQVMEHVENFDTVLSEIRRVLKPGGVVLSLFPDKGVWREGHCGISFLHWFPKGSRLRVYYAAIFRILGFGYHKGNKGVMRWSKDFCDWLDKWTWYRSPAEIQSAYDKYFTATQHIEDYWLRQRVGVGKTMVNYLPATVQQLVVRKFVGLVFTSRKSSVSLPFQRTVESYVFSIG
jgi:SAM-dependent methyltransferase